MRGQRHAPAALNPGKDPVPIVEEAGWAPGPVWTGAEKLAPTGIRSPDRPARSQSLYRLSYRAREPLMDRVIPCPQGTPSLTMFLFDNFEGHQSKYRRGYLIGVIRVRLREVLESFPQQKKVCGVAFHAIGQKRLGKRKLQNDRC